MVLRLIAGLTALLCLLGLAYGTRQKPRNVTPTKLERTCSITTKGTHPLFDPPRQAFVPCHLLDEYLQASWSI